jgi:predicted N-acetyltransferase YhbS
MNSPSLHVIAPDIPIHGDEIARLIAHTFHDDPSPETLARIRGMAELPDWVQADDCRIGLLDGTVVTSTTVFRYLTRIGGARLVTAGIGAVATHKDYRKRGLMRQTFGGMVEALPEAGYDVSVLFGIPDFYWQFGYVRGWSDDTFSLKATALQPACPAPATESFAGPDLPEAVLACMNRWQENLDGTAVRPTGGGRNKHQGEHIQCLAWRDENGELDGTLILKLEEKRVLVEDACGDPETVIALVANACQEHEREEAAFPRLHYRSPLARRLRLGDCQVHRSYRRNGGALVRVVNLRSCLEKLRDDFSARLAPSRYHDWHGLLTVDDGREEVGLRLAAGTVRVVSALPSLHQLHAGDYAASLVFGAEDPADTLARPQVETTGLAAELATILFPELDPQLPSLDRY